MEILTAANHNQHFDPHPQYNSYYRVESQLSPDNDHVWLKIFEKTLQHDAQGVKESGQSFLRRLELDAYVYDGVSEAQQDLSVLHLLAYVSKDQNPYDNNHNIYVNLGLTPIYNDYTRYKNNNYYNPSNIFKLFVKDTGNKDINGVPIYTITLYGRTQGYDAVISLQPFNCRMTLAQHAASRNATDVTTNQIATEREKIDGLIGDMGHATWQSQAEMVNGRDDDLLWDTAHPAQPTAYEQVYSNTTGDKILLMPQTTMLTLTTTTEFPAYPVSYIVPTLWQDYDGFKLTLLTFGFTNIKNTATFNAANADNSIAKKNGVDHIYEAGSVITLMRYKNYWLEV